MKVGYLIHSKKKILCFAKNVLQNEREQEKNAATDQNMFLLNRNTV